MSVRDRAAAITKGRYGAHAPRSRRSHTHPRTRRRPPSDGGAPERPATIGRARARAGAARPRRRPHAPPPRSSDPIGNGVSTVAAESRTRLPTTRDERMAPCRASAKSPVGAGGVDTGPPHAGAPTLPPCREAAAGRDGVSAVAARPRTRPPDTSRRPHCPVHAPMKNGRHGQWAANATHAPTVVRQGMDGVARDVTPRRSRTRSVSAARRAPLRPRGATDTRAATSPEGRSGAAGSAVADLRAPLWEPTCSRSAMCATR